MSFLGSQYFLSVEGPLQFWLPATIELPSWLREDLTLTTIACHLIVSAPYDSKASKGIHQ